MANEKWKYNEDSSEVLVIYWNKWGREKYLVCFHVLEDKEILNMWTTGLVTRTWKKNWRGPEDSDSEVMTRTRTRTWRWWLGLGLRGDDSDSDLTIWTRTQHWLLHLCTSNGSPILGVMLFDTAWIIQFQIRRDLCSIFTVSLDRSISVGTGPIVLKVHTSPADIKPAHPMVHPRLEFVWVGR